MKRYVEVEVEDMTDKNTELSIAFYSKDASSLSDLISQVPDIREKITGIICASEFDDLHGEQVADKILQLFKEEE